MNKRITLRVLCILLAALTLLPLAACELEADTTEEITESVTESATVTETQTESETTSMTETETETVTETVTETETETETETHIPASEILKDSEFLKYDRISPAMKYLFGETEVKSETLMFIDYGDTKQLLFKPTEIISVTSYDGKTVYEEGKDYAVTEDGKITILEGSSMPCITSENYYDLDYTGTTLYTMHNGKQVKTYWGEGSSMTKWQVAVNYKHAGEWDGFLQDSQLDAYLKFIQKLEAGKNVTVVFYGDSITRGANASYYVGTEPYQVPYPLLFTYALADLYKYTVAHIPVGQPSTADKPTDDYVAGMRGTIFFINGSVGGWNSEKGAGMVQDYIINKTKIYGCDLFVLAFGMNDGGTALKKFSANIKKTVNAVLKSDDEASIMLVSSMEPNPEGVNWQGDQDKHEEVLFKLAEDFMDDGVPCAVACMNSVSQAVLTRKQFVDYTGNNINHPNDFFMRVYAQTLLQTLIGYENLK